jgi:tetratricopeptide (TPR) repeat protein
MNKKNLLIILGAIIVIGVVVWAIFFRDKNIPLVSVIPEKIAEITQKIEEQPILENVVTTVKKTAKIGAYSELTPAVIEEIGGQEVVNTLVKKYEQAIKDLTTAIEKYGKGGNKEEEKPGVLLFVNASNQAFYLRKYDEAIKYLQDVFQYYDKSDIALINLAHIYERQGNYQLAIDTYLEFYKDFETKSFYDLDIMQDYISLGMREKVAEYYANYKKEGYSNEAIEQYLNNN